MRNKVIDPDPLHPLKEVLFDAMIMGTPQNVHEYEAILTEFFPKLIKALDDNIKVVGQIYIKHHDDDGQPYLINVGSDFRGLSLHLKNYDY